MKTNTIVLACGFSHHAQPFRIGYSASLKTYLFRLQTEGSCQAYFNGQLQTVQTGDLLLYKPGDAYELVIDRQRQLDQPHPGKVYSSDYHVLCQGDWIDDWWKRSSRRQILRIDPDEQVLPIWRLLIAERRRLHRESSELSEYLLRSLLLSFDLTTTMAYDQTGPAFVASRMKRYIEEHATAPFKLEELAQNVGLSVSRAVHLFKENFQKTIIQYTHEIRLSIAVERMKYSNMTLEQIAETCGFGSYSHFFRVFRKHYGVAPTQYLSQKPGSQ